jgi:hypothetical protein
LHCSDNIPDINYFKGGLLQFQRFSTVHGLVHSGHVRRKNIIETGTCETGYSLHGNQEGERQRERQRDRDRDRKREREMQQEAYLKYMPLVTNLYQERFTFQNI